MKSLRLCLVGALLATPVTAMSGCATTGKLVARDGSHRLVANDAKSGASVVLTTSAWDTTSRLSDEITIVHVLVANHGTEPLLIAPGDFKLLNQNKFRFALLDTGSTFVSDSPDVAPQLNQRLEYDHGQTHTFRDIRGMDNELSRSALPWGVLLPGTEMRGFVYFERVTSTSNQANMHWHITTPTRKSLAEFVFPLHVSRPSS